MVQFKNIKAPEFQKVGMRKVEAIKLLNSHGKRGSDFKTEEEVIDFLRALRPTYTPVVNTQSKIVQELDSNIQSSIDNEIDVLKKKLAELQLKL
jgi:hypothetical protein